jgi:MFS family permease
MTDLLLPMTLIGIGAGLSFTSLSMIAMADAQPSDAGLAGGVLNTTTQVGAALGLAIFATLASDRTRQLIVEGHNSVAALSDGYHLTWAISAGIVLVTLVLTATVLRPESAANALADEADDEMQVRASA